MGPGSNPTGYVHDVGVHLYVHRIRASMWISQFATILYPHWLPNSLDFSLMVVLITVSKWISKFIWSPLAILYYHSLQVNFQTHWIMSWKCISKFTASGPTCGSANVVENYIAVDLHNCWMIPSEWIYEFARLQFSDSPPITHQHHPLPVYIYCVLMDCVIDR